MNDEPESAKEAMIRWQGYARESRTAVNSHFLAYAAAILALQTSTLLNKDVTVIAWPCTFLTAGFLALSSLMLGSAIVLIRLRDARLTARTARYRHSGRSQKEIDQLRAATDCLGKWTNRLIPLQVISFSGGALLFVVWVTGTSWGKL
jgi:hypothetical protein